MALTLAGTAMSAGGAIMQGQQANAAAQAQAKAIEQQAEADRRSTAFEVSQEHRRQSLAMSAARAQVGASGVGFQGSPTAVLTANAAQGELDIQAILYGSQLRQNTLSTQASLSRLEGRQKRAGAFASIPGMAINNFKDHYQPTRAVRMGTNPFAGGGLY